MDEQQKKMFDEYWRRAKAFLEETGQYDDFLEWQKKHGVAVPVEEDKDAR